MIVKNVLVAIALLFSTAGGSYVQSLNSVRANIATDGEYVGLSKMPSLSPEDSDTAWFHENTLLVKNDEAILDEVPVTIRHGQKEYSASDGGFLTYRARFIVKDGKASLRCAWSTPCTSFFRETNATNTLRLRLIP
jgi:hypothetical protein